ncbi:hypothetical protein P154DRAFT_519990 [Amniculicola lignicola CBS 123094]|uniref:WSC domain-containing protein n=1 Tax=Amniculicola lignicola CBS 123094 TaxID=1392246 RepID=A0A6A5WSL4_9PLEO|nr:hypothetical protein P154DRAFT_519990 [Amniculicola lignicola CBS 123094]
MGLWLLFSLLMLVRRSTAGNGVPYLQWDPDTAKDCIDWYDNNLGETCEYVRSYFHITPEEFHQWNPSVGVDCKPWRYQSYCLVTETKWNATFPTTTSILTTKFSSTTTNAATIGPSPTSWSYLGCYVEDPTFPILDQNMNPNGDPALTIPKCKSSCYRRMYKFAAVQKGNQCWCGTYVGGEWSRNQTDCNTPCTGDKNSFCGGSGFLNVYQAEENLTPASTSTMISIDAPVTRVSVTQSATTSKAGASKRNGAMLWTV